METTKKRRRSSLLLCLPTPLLQEILSRLPLKALPSCKLACKQLLAVVSDPEFVDLHLSRSRPHLLYRCSPFLSEPCRHVCFLFDPESRFSLSLFDILGDEGPTNLLAPWYGPKVSLINSCNGLLCLSTRSGHLAVCNPILGEIIWLPELTNCSHVCRVAIGIGAKQKLFKVVCAVPKNGGGACKYEAMIYVIGPAPFHIFDPSKSTFCRWNMDASVNGVVHWFDRIQMSSPVIHAFDFDTERFSVIPLPKKMDIDPDFGMQVGVFEECLVVYGLAKIRREKLLPAEVWIMKEYGVEESWTKLYTVDDFSGRVRLPRPIVHPVKVLGDSDKKALTINKTCLVSYDCKSMPPHRLDALPLLHWLPEDIPVVSLVPSLVSLRHIASPEKVVLYFDHPSLIQKNYC